LYRAIVVTGVTVSSNEPAPLYPAGPTAPVVTSMEVLKQFWADAYGKEVQSAATYSYTWLADQFGHVCIGIIVDFAGTLVSSLAIHYFLGPITGAEYWSLVLGLALTVIGVSLWELSAYRSSVKEATGTFPTDTKLLAANAIVATAYMSLGGVLGFAFHLTAVPALLISAAVVIVAIILAPGWLRQKMIWQKASIPYLFRLADATRSIKSEDAKLLQDIIDAGAPPGTKPYQVVIGGPIGSGRTSIAAGIATEFAFKNNKVRYLGLDCLLEFAVNSVGGLYPNEDGPTTINYWPWSEAQVVVIDGVGPFVAVNEPNREANFTRFQGMLQNDLKNVADVLKNCHTIWVLGDLCPPPPRDQMGAVLASFAQAVAEYCNSGTEPMIVELDAPPRRQATKRSFFGSTRAAPRATAVRGVWRVSRKS
jgi:hypothetical protein